MIDLIKLKGYIPDSVIEQIPTIKEITTPLRLAHFLAQTAHESANFAAKFENLNYSADALRRVFPKHFTYEQAIAYARDPIRIGNRAYANRMGNGDEKSGDGYKYRGRGFIQLTGATNYKAFSQFIGEDCYANPDLVATKYPLSSAAFFFTTNHIWDVCDRGDSDNVVGDVTKKINPSMQGLVDRIKRFLEIRQLLY
jgi:putative chitinase